MAEVCRKYDMKLLTYGTLVRYPSIRNSHEVPTSTVQCGGLLSDQYLGASEPDPYDSSMTPSKRKVVFLAYSITCSNERTLVSGYDTRRVRYLEPLPDPAEGTSPDWGLAWWDEYIGNRHTLGARP
jgi:hypothetical protein